MTGEQVSPGRYAENGTETRVTAKKSDDDFKKNVEVHYRQLMKQCKVHMEEQDKALPPARVDLKEELSDRGVTRREFLKWTSVMTAALMLPPIFKPLVGKAAEQLGRLPVVWAPPCRMHRLLRVFPEGILSERGPYSPGHDFTRVP